MRHGAEARPASVELHQCVRAAARLWSQVPASQTGGPGAVTKPIPDKAEIALEYPNKFYIGTFERTARFDAHLDKTGVSLTLERTGDAAEKKAVRMHFHYSLFAEILEELAETASAMPRHDKAHREAVRDARTRTRRRAGGARGRTCRAGRDDAGRRGPAAAHPGVSAGPRSITRRGDRRRCRSDSSSPICCATRPGTAGRASRCAG